MYAFAPVSLGALRRRDPDRHRPYKMPMPAVLNPAAFASANLIIYWTGFDVVWKLLALIFLGRVLFEIAIRRADVTRTDIDWQATSWIWPWLIGMTVISVLGRYGHGHNVLPQWVDLVVVIAFSVGIYFYAITLAMSETQVQAALASEDWLMPSADEESMTVLRPGTEK
jgi:amino acid transporter